VIVKDSQGRENVYFDERDSSTGGGSYKTHYVTIDGVQAEKTYKVSINSGRIRYGISGSLNNNCSASLKARTDSEPLSITTPYELSALSIRGNPVNGTVWAEESVAATGAIVCVNIEGIAPLSGLVSGSGFWLVPLSGVLRNDLSSEADSLPDGLNEEIYVIGEGNQSSFAVNLTGNDNPVPEMFLGNEYDFKSERGVSPTPVAGGTTPTPRRESKGFGLDKGEALQIIAPEGEINDTLPTIRGRGKPGTTLEIVIESETIEGTVRVNSDGSWSFVPSGNLDPGEHTVTVSFVDSSGVLQKVSKRFIVLGKSPLLPDTSGTPSGQTLPTPSPTPREGFSQATPTATPTIEDYEAPTISPTEAVYDGELLTTANELPIFIILTIGLVGATLGVGTIIKMKKKK